jgi:hypothetical protein
MNETTKESESHQARVMTEPEPDNKESILKKILLVLGLLLLVVGIILLAVSGGKKALVSIGDVMKQLEN